MNTSQQIVRYIVVKDDEDRAYYNLGLGAKEAYSYAISNAARYHSDFYCELANGEFKLIKSYK